MSLSNSQWSWQDNVFIVSLSTAVILILSTVAAIRCVRPAQTWLAVRKGKRKVRVYMDGCFDLMHFGHANALRQAKALGDVLVVGVVSDEEIRVNKGPPVLNMKERLRLVAAVKWVDEVLPDTPYCITEGFMEDLFTRHRIDFIVHGDDPCVLPDGSDAYALAKKAGRYREIKRTEGVSSTDIVGRILQCIQDKQPPMNAGHAGSNGDGSRLALGNGQLEGGGHAKPFAKRVSHFLPTSRRIVQFSSGKPPSPNDKVVYIDGAFDLFHAGHVEVLEKARQLGDFLLVGIHTDAVVSAELGSFHPILGVHERSLSVLACTYVDEVIIGAPREVTHDLITTFNVSVVVCGRETDNVSSDAAIQPDAASGWTSESGDPYAIPKSLGILQVLESQWEVNNADIMRRIANSHEVYVKRNERKEASESKYYMAKQYVADQ